VSRIPIEATGEEARVLFTGAAVTTPALQRETSAAGGVLDDE